MKNTESDVFARSKTKIISHKQKLLKPCFWTYKSILTKQIFFFFFYMWEKRKANVYTADSIYNVQVARREKKKRKKKKNSSMHVFRLGCIYVHTDGI